MKTYELLNLIDLTLEVEEPILSGLASAVEAIQPQDTNPITPVWTITPPVFSWDRPIEDVILEKVRYMIRSWKHMEVANIHKSVRKEARSIIMAYETIEKDIEREIDLRAKIAAGRQKRVSDLELKDPDTTTEPLKSAPKSTNDKEEHYSNADQ